MMKVKAKELHGKKLESQLHGKSASVWTETKYNQDTTVYGDQEDTHTKRRLDESRELESTNSWDEIHEVIESDFLISPGDIYPSRKVEIQDAEISQEMLEKFKLLCEEQHEAFSKNNQDFGKTQLIKMEIDTGGSVPLAQSPYTLPLKHYDWVRKEIETLEKAGVIE